MCWLVSGTLQTRACRGDREQFCAVDGAQAARPEVAARLRALPGVTVIPRDDKLKYRHAHSRIWNETWLAAFFHKPCNHELFVLQSLNMEGTQQTWLVLRSSGMHAAFQPAALCPASLRNYQ